MNIILMIRAFPFNELLRFLGFACTRSSRIQGDRFCADEPIDGFTDGIAMDVVLTVTITPNCVWLIRANPRKPILPSRLKPAENPHVDADER